MHIILLGVQGSGKGTQAAIMAKKYHLSIFETGKKFRAMSASDHLRATEVKATIDAGSLVSDDLVLTLLEYERESLAGDAALFDGMPRTLPQLTAFESVFPEFIVVFLDLSDEEAMQRLVGRRVDAVTGESFPPSYVGSTSPTTGNPLIVRADDTPEAITKRLKVFRENTLPLIDACRAHGKTVYTIDASKSIEKVTADIDRAVGKYF